jgi:integrase/recombinase XerD
MEALLVVALQCRKGASHDCSSTTNDGGYAGTESVTSHAGIVSPTGFAVRTPLRWSPDALTPEHIRTYQIYLTNEKKLAAGSIHIAVAALRFLYKITLKREWTFADVLPLPKKPQKLPVVLSPEEVVQFLGRVGCRKQRVILTACYAAGLRVSEAVRLNAGAIDSKRMVIRVDQGKGRKDRYVMLSPKLLEILRVYWKAAHPKEWLFLAD